LVIGWFIGRLRQHRREQRGRRVTYRAAVARWPGARITLRQGARVIEDSRRLRVVSSQ
jgi:hypothetical protein